MKKRIPAEGCDLGIHMYGNLAMREGSALPPVSKLPPPSASLRTHANGIAVRRAACGTVGKKENDEPKLGENTGISRVARISCTVASCKRACRWEKKYGNRADGVAVTRGNGLAVDQQAIAALRPFHEPNFVPVARKWVRVRGIKSKRAHRSVLFCFW